MTKGRLKIRFRNGNCVFIRPCVVDTNQGSGRNHIQTATQPQPNVDAAPIHHFSGNRQNMKMQDKLIMLMAKILALRGTAPLFSQFCIMGPK